MDLVAFFSPYMRENRLTVSISSNCSDCSFLLEWVNGNTSLCSLGQIVTDASNCSANFALHFRP
jgi:hypothetical protein